MIPEGDPQSRLSRLSCTVCNNCLLPVPFHELHAHMRTCCPPEMQTVAFHGKVAPIWPHAWAGSPRWVRVRPRPDWAGMRVKWSLTPPASPNAAAGQGGCRWVVDVSAERPGGSQREERWRPLARVEWDGSHAQEYTEVEEGELLRLVIRPSQSGGGGGEVQYNITAMPKDLLPHDEGGCDEGASLVPTVSRWSQLLSYPARHFERLRRELVEPHVQGVEQSGGRWRRSEMFDIAEWGLPMPFDRSMLVSTFEIRKRFNSKQKPLWVRFVAEQQPPPQGGGRTVCDAIMKVGDDLRTDQAVLKTLELFNTLWEEHGVTHRVEPHELDVYAGVAPGAGRTDAAAAAAAAADADAAGTYLLPVQCPLYRVAAVPGHQSGFVEMLPSSVPVEELQEVDDVGRNGLKAVEQMLLPTAVAAFVSGYVLEIGDRHKGNMVVTGLSPDKRFANVDFGWLGTHPSHDTGAFPLPEGLRYYLKHSEADAHFLDLCWDALQVLRLSADRIERGWRRLLGQCQLDHSAEHQQLQYDVYIGAMRARLGADTFTVAPETAHPFGFDRSLLDREIQAASMDTWIKNKLHDFKVEKIQPSWGEMCLQQHRAEALQQRCKCVKEGFLMKAGGFVRFQPTGRLERARNPLKGGRLEWKKSYFVLFGDGVLRWFDGNAPSSRYKHAITIRATASPESEESTGNAEHGMEPGSFVVLPRALEAERVVYLRGRKAGEFGRGDGLEAQAQADSCSAEAGGWLAVIGSVCAAARRSIVGQITPPAATSEQDPEPPLGRRSDSLTRISSAAARSLCKHGCGRESAPGQTQRGNHFDTCCKACNAASMSGATAETVIHDPACQIRWHRARRDDPRWVQDSESSACMLCASPFGPLGLFRSKRYHCHYCGLVVCGDCGSCSTSSAEYLGSGRSTLPIAGLADHQFDRDGRLFTPEPNTEYPEQRVCRACFSAGVSHGVATVDWSSRSPSVTVGTDETGRALEYPAVAVKRDMALLILRRNGKQFYDVVTLDRQTAGVCPVSALRIQAAPEAAPTSTSVDGSPGPGPPQPQCASAPTSTAAATSVVGARRAAAIAGEQAQEPQPEPTGVGSSSEVDLLPLRTVKSAEIVSATAVEPPGAPRSYSSSKIEI
jgi:hypothetical protein